ncbi:MAG TPA: ABC transporter permease [Dokdonella sp.]|uniref:ABC transporter permease n=1 Tax=Dokdonella sp. TaxID=2291710 RepID=UPI002D80949E|nr:ABC transporter permease [Dokdonella sp.]HET9033601.1 ABC transporter permease [Dokdonella sp.]
MSNPGKQASGWFDDLRIAARGLLGQRGFFFTAVLTMTLGIGAVTAIFTVYDAVLLKPLPFQDAERIVRIKREKGPSVQVTTSVPVFDEWRDKTHSAFDAIGAYVPETMNLAGNDDAQRLSVYKVTPGFWDVFSQPIALGHSWGEEEENHNVRVVVLSDRLWRSRFAASKDVIGRDVRLNDDVYRIVGVASAQFSFPDDVQVWVPTFTPGNAQSRRTMNFLSVLGRRSATVSAAQAAASVQSVIDWQVQTFPADESAMQAMITPLSEQIGAPVSRALGMLLAASALVLLIACANLAGLMLARGQAREQELSLRCALGAQKGRLMRHVLAESVLIALAGTLAGLLVAKPAIAGLMALAPDLLPAYNLPTINLRVIAATSAIALGTVLVFALYPAWRAAAADPVKALQGASRSQTGSVRQMRARSLLVSAEIALAMTLLAGAGLLIGSLQKLAEVDSGVKTDHVLTAQFSISTLTLKPGDDLNAWAGNAMKALNPRLDSIEKRLAALPGVESVALSFGLPASGNANWTSSFQIVGEPKAKSEVQMRFVSQDYFKTYGIPVEAGRPFNALDGTRALLPTELLVNQAFADRYLAGADPLSREIITFGDDPIRIIGVVGNVHQAGLDRDVNPELYFPVSKAIKGDMSIGLKVRGDTLAYAEVLRKAMREVAPDAPVYEVRSMDSVIGSTLGLRRFNMTLMSVFAAVAMLLAAIGLYGVIAFSVAQRRREIGLRQALGASRLAIHRLMFGLGLRMVVPGILVGTLGALALGRLISAQLYGMGAINPLLLFGVVLVLAAVAVVACAIPSLRASGIAPMEALRDE